MALKVAAPRLSVVLGVCSHTHLIFYLRKMNYLPLLGFNFNNNDNNEPANPNPSSRISARELPHTQQRPLSGTSRQSFIEKPLYRRLC